MNSIKRIVPGAAVSAAIAVPSWLLGRLFPVVGAPVFAILAGMCVTLIWKKKGCAAEGIAFTAKKVLQWAVVLLGFGLNLSVILQTGRQSLPIILCTVSAALVTAFVLCRLLKIDGTVATLVGVGSSICGGSAIAAAAPVIRAGDEEVAQSISVIFLFNVIAALVFPAFGQAIGFSTESGEAFGVFAGTAVNDTSSVTAAASTWDSLWNLGSQTLDKAVTVKLTRTLAIIPITLVLALIQARKARAEGAQKASFSLASVFPFFILYFIAASVITTAAYALADGTDVLRVIQDVFSFFKSVSKFCIVMAMAAIGLNSDIVKLVKSGGKPVLLGAACWAAVTAVSLAMQRAIGLW